MLLSPQTPMLSIRNLLVVGSALGAACASGAPETAGFVYRLGTDTTAVSSVTWSRGRVEGTYVNRVPTTSVQRWVATVGGDGGLQRIERTQASGADTTERVVITFAADTATVERTRGDSVTTTRVATGGIVLPRHPATDPGLIELLTRNAVSRGTSEYLLRTFFAGDTAASTDTLRVVADTVLLAGGRFRIDSIGRLLTVGGNGERATLDINALSSDFAARPLGELSPRDSTAATIGGANVSVAYGSPRKRGRDIFGALVPWDQPWRTGANVATFLTTDRNLQIGVARVPAGRYSVFTVPSQSGWTLLLSSNLGDNAAGYDSTTIVARTPMEAGAAAEPFENLTIVLEPAGLLRISWDRTTATVGVRAR